MKKIFIIFVLLTLVYSQGKAQLATVDAATNAQLIILNKSITAMELTLGKMTTASTGTAASTAASEGYLHSVEQALVIVSNSLKTGIEFNNILNSEARIIKKVRDLNSFMVKNKISNKDTQRLISNNIASCLKATSSLVDLAIDVLSDNIYRMDTEQRRSYLKDITSQLFQVEYIVDKLNSNIKVYVLTFGK